MSGTRFEHLDEPAWEVARSQFDGGTVFHSWWFLQLAATALRARFHPLALTRDSVVVALVPIVEQTRGPLRTFNWVPFPYIGPLTSSAELPMVLSELAQLARRRRAAVIQLSFRQDQVGLREHLERARYVSTPEATMVLVVAEKSREELWAGMRKNGRRDLRNAEAAGLSVREASRADVVDCLPRLLVGIPDTGWPAQATAEAAWNALSGTGNAWMRSVVDANGNTQAVTITLLDGTTAYLWLGAARRLEGVDAHAPIYWDAIGRTLDEGLEQVDMVGTPTQQIAAYKRKFGATQASLLVAQRFRVPGYRRLQGMHELLTNR